MKILYTILFATLFHAQLLIAQHDLAEVFQVMDVWLAAQQEFDDLPGISVAIVADQDIIYSRGFGQSNQTTGQAATSDTRYSICSISKLFTAVAVMKLYDQGKLRLDDKVSDLLPFYDLKQQFEESGPVTVRSLLSHSSGLPREAANPYWTPDFPFPTQAQVRDGLASQQTLYPASTYFQYSNLGLTLLGEIVEVVSGQPYDQFIQENILDPLAMHQTSTGMPAELHGTDLALGYSATRRNGERDEVALFAADGVRAAAGFSSTVNDLANFAKWQFRLRETHDDEILKSSTLKEMQRVHWTDPDWTTTWGLGFVVHERDGRTWAGHGGSCPGYRSSITLDLEKKIAYIAMINASGTDPHRYLTGLSGLLDAYGEPTDTITQSFDQYAGFYDLQPWWGEEYIFPWKGKLGSLGLPTESPGDLTTFEHIEDDRFRRVRKNDALGEAMWFERDTSGKVIKVWQHGNYNVKLNHKP